MVMIMLFDLEIFSRFQFKFPKLFLNFYAPFAAINTALSYLYASDFMRHSSCFSSVDIPANIP